MAGRLAERLSNEVAKMSNADVFQFWGKAQPLPGADLGWHPLVFHCIDVAAVGSQLLQEDRCLSERLCGLMGLEATDLAHLARYLLALHDIGKFAKRFQAKAPARYPKCFDGSPEKHQYDHAAGGLELFEADCDLFGVPPRGKRAWRTLVSAVTGHHGAPPKTDMLTTPTIVTLRKSFGRLGIEAARQFAADARALFNPPTDLPLPPRNLGPASFALAGIAVLADWLGSNQEWFPYQSTEAFPTRPNGNHGVDLERYWLEAQARAARALKESGVLPASTRDGLCFGDLIGNARPSPMQQWAESVDLPAGPALFVIEDETGSGKTEAAVMLAHRLMAAGKAKGIYVALPTMATANAMFERLAARYRKLFSEGQPSIALVHGARGMQEGFREAVQRGGRKERSYVAGDAEEDSDTTASSACAAWLADDRRRSLLADVGVGTVDQALLSILPSRHQSLRLLGLMRKVLILDEVHAYDAYMQREIETLLEFHAGLGGSAILLSATLPKTVRQRLGAAFAKGSGHVRATDESLENAYPLATAHAGATSTETPVDGRADRSRKLPVRFLRGPQEAFDEVERAACKGQAVLYIRNSVDDVSDAYDALRERELDVDIFHARFTLADRLKMEQRIVDMFGKASTPKQRAGKGKVLVATQVVEQSLDLDFDAMVSDLAPIDLLIQRAGRLWRHGRRERQGSPELLVVSPAAMPDAAEDWFSKPFPRAQFVYRAHARLWLTAKALGDVGAIDSPAGLRTLIEAVYGEGVEAGVPSSLQSAFWDAEGRERAERGVASVGTLGLQSGYMRDGGAWDGDVSTATRLADDPQVTLRLARIREGRVEPYADAEGERWRAWRLSEVSVAKRRISGEYLPSEHAAAASGAKAEWGRYDQDKILILLEEEGGRAVGSARLGEGDPHPVRVEYGEQGLIFAGLDLPSR